MKLQSGGNIKFEMDVVGYQFPQTENEPYDSDWLNIHVSVKHPRGSWSKTDACMMTFELAQLIEWFRGLADNCPSHSEKYFTEPELSFKWFGEGKNVLRINLDYSLRPAWSPYDGENEEEELFVEFEVTPEDLKAAAASLVEKLKKFPVRVGI